VLKGNKRRCTYAMSRVGGGHRGGIPTRGAMPGLDQAWKDGHGRRDADGA
jgi:hypothetical protein